MYHLSNCKIHTRNHGNFKSFDQSCRPKTGGLRFSVFTRPVNILYDTSMTQKFYGGGAVKFYGASAVKNLQIKRQTLDHRLWPMLQNVVLQTFGCA